MESASMREFSGIFLIRKDSYYTLSVSVTIPDYAILFPQIGYWWLEFGGDPGH